MSTPKPQERWALSYTVEGQSQISPSGLIYGGDTLFTNATVVIQHVYDGGAVRFLGAPPLPGCASLGHAYGQVATPAIWKSMNPRRLTPREGDVWLLEDGPQVEVEYVYADGHIQLAFQDGTRATTPTQTWMEDHNPTLVGTYQTWITLFGVGFGWRFVPEV